MADDDRPGTPGDTTDPTDGGVPATGHGSVAARLEHAGVTPADVALPSEDVPQGAVSGARSPLKYATLGEIARGGMGAIVKLLDNDIRRPVAMKVILGGGDPGRVTRFVEEAQVTGQLEHPNIVPVHELGLDPRGKVYFTMKLVRGRTLEAIVERISEKDPATARDFPLSRLLQVFLKVCDAVAFAHSKGVIHRDLKPENVMVGRFGEVLVMDWGLAKVKGRADTAGEDLVATIRSDRETGRTLDGQVMGTPSYMPPEQAAGRLGDVDERSDVFALGGILYKILTHEAPHTGDTVFEALAAAVKGDVKTPRRRSPWLAIPAELESVCLKAMALDRKDRYPDVGAVAEDIGAYLDHRPVRAHRYGPAGLALRFVQRHPTGSVSTAVALLVLSLGAAASGVAIGEARAYRARARQEAAERERATERAELEAFRRAEAERARTAAVGERDEARADLEKGRLVSAVLQAADAELGQARTEIERAFHADRPPEERRAVWARHSDAVARFEKAVAADPASRAAWLSVKGWLLSLSGQEAETKACFAGARGADPDVTYGWLFEAMAFLSTYLQLFRPPEFVLSYDGKFYADKPAGETELLRRVRGRFEEMVEGAARARVWGKASSGEFREALDGMRGLHEGGYARTELGLSRALQVEEMSFLRDTLLFARTEMRFLCGDFEGGISDVERFLARHPESPKGLTWKASLLMLKASAMSVRGEDPVPPLTASVESLDRAKRLATASGASFGQRLSPALALGVALRSRGISPLDTFRKALEECDDALRKDPDDAPMRAHRGMVLLQIAETEGGTGADPGARLSASLADLEEAHRRRPDDVSILGGRAQVLLSFARYREKRGEDGLDLFRRSIADCAAALALRPDYADAFLTRGNAHQFLGEAEAARRADPRDSLDRAVQDCTEGLRLRPDDPFTLNNRGTAYRWLGEAQGDRGEDPRESFRRSIADCDAALRGNPRLASAFNNRGVSWKNLGMAQAGRGEDPGEAYGKAIDDFGEALRINPEYANALSNRGNARYHLGQAVEKKGGDATDAFLKAIEDHGEALRRNPALESGHLNRAVVHLSLGDARAARRQDPREDYRRCVEDCGEALAKNPREKKPYGFRGTARRKLGNLEAARGGDPRELYRGAIADFTEALAGPEKDAAAFGSRGSAHLGLAEAEARRGEDARETFRRAIADFDEALRTAPDYLPSRMNRCSACSGLAQAAAAWGDDPEPLLRATAAAYEDAIRAKPDVWQAHYGLGLALEWLGRFGDSNASYRKAKEAAGRAAPPLEQRIAGTASAAAAPPWIRQLLLGDSLFRMGSYRHAVPAFEEGLRGLDPGAPLPSKDWAQPVLDAVLDYGRASSQLSIGKGGRLAPKSPVDPAEVSACRAKALEALGKAAALADAAGAPHPARLLQALASQPDLDPLRDLPEFQALAGERKEKEKAK